MSLGHAHSLVLCQGQHSQSHTTELYVFGSNHFGQLGTYTPSTSTTVGDDSQRPPDDEFNFASQVKSLIPIKLDIGNNVRIRLIHTKFFSNVS